MRIHKSQIGRAAIGLSAGFKLGQFCLSLVVAGLASPAWAQSGAYTLTSGTVTLSSLTETATNASESGIFVYNSGNLTVGTVTVTTSDNATNSDASGRYGVNAGILAGTSGTKGVVPITGSSNIATTTGSIANGLFATYGGSSNHDAGRHHHGQRRGCARGGCHLWRRGHDLQCGCHYLWWQLKQAVSTAPGSCPGEARWVKLSVTRRIPASVRNGFLNKMEARYGSAG